MDTVEKEATGFAILAVIVAAVFIAVTSGCSVSGSIGYHGQTGKDDRTISPTLYPDGVSQRREAAQRY